MKTILISIILATALSIAPAFAEIEQVSIPFPPPYMLDCSYSVGEFLIFNCIWRSDRIPANVTADLEQLEKSIDILPAEEYEASKDKIILDWIYADDIELEVEPEPPKPTVRDILVAKLPAGVKEAVDRLKECQYGYDGWEAIQQQTEYEIPDQFIRSVDDYTTDKIVGDLNKAFEACRIQRDYPLPANYQNFIDADVLGLDRFGREPTHTFGQTTNFTRASEIYKPLDQLDFLNAEKTATDFMCSDEGKALGHCIKDEFTGVNRGNPNPIIKDLKTYNDYINFKAGQIQTEQDYIDTITAAKEAQCTVHYPIYKHRLQTADNEGGMELPVWLEHCESPEDEELRIGFACYSGGDRILCSELAKIKAQRNE